MADPKKAVWWRRTALLAAATTIVWIAVGVVLQVEDTRIAGTGSILGMPAGYFLATIAAPVGMAVVLFFFARRQKAIDRRFGGGEG